MADQEQRRQALAAVLAENPQDLGALLAAMPNMPEPTLSSRAQQAHEWLTTNVLSPAQHAGFYPVQVLSRYMDPEQKTDFWRWRGPLGRVITNKDWEILGQMMDAHDAIVPEYKPGNRQSDQLEDRRWMPGMSVWRFY